MIRSQLFHKLLSEHKELSDEHKRMKIELDKSGMLPLNLYITYTWYLFHLTSYFFLCQPKQPGLRPKFPSC